jgi:3-methyladenine DNA glycosylase/8-oxoguanine DNA glycosylase
LVTAIVPEPDTKRKQFRVDRAIRQAERQLADADPVMKLLIAQHGRCPLAERSFEPFHMLANSIISQQLSTRAAATIKAADRRACRRAVSNG